MIFPTITKNAVAVNHDILNHGYAVGANRFAVQPPIKTCIEDY